MILILDLDDTIFETRSMDMTVFDPAKRVVEEFALGHFGNQVSTKIIEEIKSIPFDIVANKYEFPDEVRSRFYTTIQNIDYQLSIDTYEDYSALKRLGHEMYLVTTGMTNLQLAKIEALGIASDFVGVFVDDPFAMHRREKIGFFREILGQREPDRFWVIGDNPESELKAGRKLGMNTIQRLNGRHDPSDHTDYTIQSFYELEKIIK